MGSKTVEFKTEIKDLLNLMIHSLYSDKDIFLRELISNSSDAIDKIRFESISDSSLLNGEEGDLGITIVPDKEANTITISDNGIGMSKEELENNLGTIAKSGTKEFVNKLKETNSEDKANLVGQFGVGFYSVFMVASKVEVTSRSAKSGDVYKWTSAGEDSFELEEATKETRGTEIVIFLNEDQAEYVETFKISSIVKKFSNFIEYPITMISDETIVEKDENDKDVEKTERKEEILNSQKPIWQKDKKDVTEEEYEEFYKFISHDFNGPAKTVHYKAEGVVDFSSILFVPEKPVSDLFNPESDYGLSLYVNRVFITDKSDFLLPKYLRFVKGVVECNDLPLNVSREIVQKSPMIEKIKKNVTSKLLREFANQLKNDKEAYVKFYNEFGVILKEGLHFDYANKEKISDLVLVNTTEAKEEQCTFADYKERMKDDQEFIYYLTGSSVEEMLTSPHLELLNKKEYEVILFSDPIDEFLVDIMAEYKEKKFKSINKGDLSELGEEEVSETDKVKFDGLVGSLKDIMKEQVSDVKISTRLVDSPCALVANENGTTVHMEKMMKAMGQEVPTQKKVLEVNVAHPIFVAMQTAYDTDAKDSRIGEYSDLLYQQALLVEGAPIENPADYAKKMAAVMADALK